MALRQWWMDQFQAMGTRGHRFTFRDLLSGNFSVLTELFRQVGGFDATLRCREDYELGARLMEARVPFAFAPAAVAWHHDETDLDRSLERARAEGQADVALGARHPELRPVLEATSARTGGALLQRLALRMPAVGGLVARALRGILGVLERARLRRRWRRLYGTVRGYWYWRGVGDALQAQRALPAAEPHGGPEVALEIDLSDGLAAAERRLDGARPAAARLRYGAYPIGQIPHVPGAERLGGIHLRRILALDLAAPFLTALALGEATPPAAARPGDGGRAP